MWRQSVQELILWVGATTSDLVLYDIIGNHLMGQGKVTMAKCLESNAGESHRILAHTHDKLGWENFL